MAEIDIKKEWKSPSGVYFLFGEEDYLKRFYAAKIRESVVGDSPFALFNHTVLAQKDFTADRAMDALATPPIGEEKKLIELCEFDLNGLKNEEADELLEFLGAAAETDYAVVVLSVADGLFDPGKYNREKKTYSGALYKRLNAVCKIAYLPHPTERELLSWVYRHFASEKITAGEAEMRHLLALVGSDMMTLTGEIDKLCAYLRFHNRDRLTAADIDLVSAGTRELEPFALSNAILAGKTDEALAILSLMEEKRQKPILAYANIYTTYTDLYRVRALLDEGLLYPDIAKKLKMNEYRAKLYAAAARNSTLTKIGDVLALCREEDLKIKSESGSYGRLRTLVCRAAKG